MGKIKQFKVYCYNPFKLKKHSRISKNLRDFPVRKDIGKSKSNKVCSICWMKLLKIPRKIPDQDLEGNFKIFLFEN